MLTLPRASTFFLVATVAFAACEDSDTPGADAGFTADAQPAQDAAPRADAAPADAGGLDATATDAVPNDALPTDGGPVAAQPRVHTLSATGHDRLFGASFGRDDKLVAIGVIANTTIAPDNETLIVRFDGDGALDMGFGTAGVYRHNLVTAGAGEQGRAIGVQSDGKIVALSIIEHSGGDARDRDIALLRLTTGGELDRGFGDQGVRVLDLSDGEVFGMNSYIADNAWGLSIQADDAIIVSASRKRTGTTQADPMVIKLTRDGAPAGGFGMNGQVALENQTVSVNVRHPYALADGRTIVSGYATTAGVVTPVIWMLTAQGMIDTTFANRGVFNDAILPAVTEAYAIAPHRDGFVTAGYGRSASSGPTDWVSLRFGPTGALDRSWGVDGASIVDIGGFGDNCRDLLVLPDNRVVLVGNGRTGASNNDGALWVLTSTGGGDRTFGPRGVRTYDMGTPSDAFWDVARASDGRLGVVGLRGSSGNGNDDVAVLMLERL